MIRMDDIYTTVDRVLLENNYWELDTTEKINQVDTALRAYLAHKLKQLDDRESTLEERLKRLPVIGLIQLLEYQMDPKDKEETLAHVIHYIINIASNLQEYEVIWYVSDDVKYKSFPETSFTDEHKWDSITTHRLTPYTEIYKTASYALNNVARRTLNK